MEIQLTVDKVSKSFGVRQIFKNVSFTIRQGEKVGLVGVNGSGKTTLLRCLLAPNFVDDGSIKYAGHVRLGYVEQGFTGFAQGESVWEFMLKACPDIVQLRARLKELEEKSTQQKGEELEATLQTYAKAEARYEHLDGYHYEANIKRVLMGLGYDENWYNAKTLALSGGQKTRLMLAAALVNAPDLLILDEPTNHLDIVMMEWLEKYLREFRGGMLLVSHDRTFLDNVTERTLEMEGGKLQEFKGNYSHYLQQKEIMLLTQTRAYAAQQEYIERTENYIRRFKAGIKSKMARGRQSQLDRLERLEAPVQYEEFTLRLPKALECADRVLILDKLKVGYGENVLVQDIELVLKRGEKVALLGPNGSGKTTLLKTILQQIPPLGGEAKIGNRVQVGYFSQSYERLNPNQTILENFLVEYGYTDEQTRKLLGSMLFQGEDVFKEIGTLSGGQKARLVLLKLVLDGANFLLLDEPTNHLDIAAKEAVEAALETFTGTVLMVSHDRYLVNEVAERIWALEEGKLVDYKGNYDFYVAAQESKAKPLEKSKAAPITTNTHKPAAPKSTAAPRRKYSPGEAQKLLPEVELAIREQEALLSVLAQEIALPHNQADLAKSTQLAEEYAEKEAYIAKLMEKWENVMESLES